MKFLQLRGRLLATCLGLAMMGSIGLVSCDKDDDDDTQDNMYTISGAASGSQMVPSVTGNGSATITGTYNGNTRVLNYTTNWKDLSGSPTVGGFYGGAAGVNGNAVGANWNLGANPQASGTLSGNMTLTEAQATDLRNGNMYYTMGTAMNAGGEVRGQMTATAANP